MASKINVDKIARNSGTPEFTVPRADGAANTILQTDGSGVLSFTPNVINSANVTYTGNSVLDIKNAGVASSIKLYCETSNQHYQEIKAAPHAGSANWTLTLPPNDGNADEFLQTNGSGVTSWATAGGNNTPSWSAYNSAAQSCTANTETVATLDSENWDTDSAFASNKFTVPAGEGGKYSISYGTKFVAINASLNVRLYLRINGTNSDYTVIGSADPDANDHYVGSNVILNLAAADYVELIAYIATATDNIQYAHMSGFKLAGV